MRSHEGQHRRRLAVVRRARAEAASPTGRRSSIVRRSCCCTAARASTTRSSSPTSTRFAEIGQVVAYDHRGERAQRRGPRDKWTMEQWGDDVASFCDALGIEKPVVVGSSFGGIVAIELRRPTSRPSRRSSCSTRRAHGMDDRRDVPGVRTARRTGGGRQQPGSSGAIRVPENLGDYSQLCLPLYSRRRRRDAEMIDMQAGRSMNLEVLEHFVTNIHPTFDQTRVARARSRARPSCSRGDDDPVRPTRRARRRSCRARPEHRALRALRRRPRHVQRAARAGLRATREFVGPEPSSRGRDLAERVRACDRASTARGSRRRASRRRTARARSTSASRSRSVTSSASVVVPGCDLVAEPLRPTRRGCRGRRASRRRRRPRRRSHRPRAIRRDRRGASPNRLAHTAPEIAVRPGCGSRVSRTTVVPSSLLTTNTASLRCMRPFDASRCAAVRNSWARNVSPNEMPTRVCGESSATTRC